MSIRSLILLVLTAGSVTVLPSSADNWYGKYDKNKDGRWDYSEFRKANKEYFKRNPEKDPLRDEELRAEFGRRATNPRGFVHESGVKDFHNW